MKYLVIVLASIQGLWMLADGIYVIANGKYIGPEKPGPWALLFERTGIDVFKLGPMFVLFGLAWLVFVGAFFGEATWARLFGIVLSVLSLWYLPVGTLLSIIVLGTLIIFVKS
ncbi:MAG TPA: hypothetical protein VJV05_04495 [Pyrinomonadaceae bacterium]|nr:hypothetical protein [Pyrinomonadaceae bacterium]